MKEAGRYEHVLLSMRADGKRSGLYDPGSWLGPSLPAFVTPNVLKILVAKYNVKPIGDPDEDLADMLSAQVSTRSR